MKDSFASTETGTGAFAVTVKGYWSRMIFSLASCNLAELVIQKLFNWPLCVCLLTGVSQINRHVIVHAKTY